MKKLLFLSLVVITACSSPRSAKETNISAAFIPANVISSAIDGIKTMNPGTDDALLEKGLRHAASLWRAEDGSPDEFLVFARENYISDPVKRSVIFRKISNYFESISGNYNEITLDLKKNLDEATGEIDEIDRMFGNYSVGSHLSDDLYSNKIAFAIALNFPYYTLEEKEKLGPSWTREEWAMARLGDYFVARVPAGLQQALAVAGGNADMYIADYNICMDKLRTDDGRQIFPDGLLLLSHWNLRDEIKADYADADKGPEKQDMIYKVMERIIKQEIPQVVINDPGYEWAPYSNKVSRNGESADAKAEPDTRYAHIIASFRAMKDIDQYNPEMNTAILRNFSAGMEISQEEVEALFDKYLSSPLLARVGKIVRERLGRDLKPYDIWYSGFRARTGFPEEQLTAKTTALYPTPAAFRAGMPGMLQKLGWSPQRARYLADKIVVDPARGSGHAWGAAMKGAVSHLRTRVSGKGMDFKGYNIAVHEFGHNVEQTISLYDVDYYMMSGVPNTAITEALAFIFQARDMFLLGLTDNNPEKEKMATLDAAWSLMEIMGVGMVDMKTWKWLYANPDATPSQLRDAVVTIATDTWNKYFAPVFGTKDSPILAIYSHMINSPLYLANYSYGQIVQFQIEEYLKGKKLSDEIDRMFSQGRLTPQQWMTGAVGTKISAQPILNALDAVLK
ncbi:MAG TPA: hypothetical protein PKL65_06105 [Bacteroidales bacterium]|nr:hypothetical protein [Bacteroidales bacterium]HNR41785.1 hypothetical protein [Bacteroidales bacterium]